MPAKSRKKLTTFQIANMLDVSDQSGSNWIDAGQLPCERTPGGHRRVEREALIAFLKRLKMGIPPELDPQPPIILIIDDEPEVGEWIGKFLRKEFSNYRFVTASDGFDAGRIIMAQRPDLVILDLYMPGMDGFEVCRRIKSDLQTQSIKVIAITAHPSDQAEQGIIDAGAEVCLTKPLDGNHLADLISDLLDEPRQKAVR